MALQFASAQEGAVLVRVLPPESWAAFAAALPAVARAFAHTSSFEGKTGQHILLPRADGTPLMVVLICEGAKARHRDGFLLAKLVGVVPPGTYALHAADFAPDGLAQAALGWLLSSYRFTRYKAAPTKPLPQLVAPEGVAAAQIERMAQAVAFGRDLINTPTNDMGPDDLEAAALALANDHGASVHVIRGDDLLAQNFPLIHAVGRAAAQAPRLVDMTWGQTWGQVDAPKITLVGKGVCYDTGGLDIKPGSAMALMKKDMGGAATVLTIARMVMEAGLPIRLRVLLPIVENAISANSFRPGDIYPSRKGIHVEIGNTDAEGRLILADVLALADEECPDLLLDFATLTGAARVALGPDLPPFYTPDEALAATISTTGAAVQDPVWRMPLWDPYDAWLDGKVATLSNISNGPFAGSITAALFLRRFVENTTAWAHFDIYGWTPVAKPGRPEGGEPQIARLIFNLLAARVSVL